MSGISTLSPREKSKFFILLLFILLFGVEELKCHDAKSLTATTITDTSIELKWADKKDIDDDEKPHQFKIIAIPIESYSNIFASRPRKWMFDYETNQAKLIALNPATKYKITVLTIEDGVEKHPVNGSFWTQISAPIAPPEPEIISNSGSVIKIRVFEASNPSGPVNSYQIIIVENPEIVQFNPETLYSHPDATSKGFPFYITGELDAPEVSHSKQFVIGDDDYYGGYHNIPLNEDSEYAIVIGAISTFNGVSKKSYSKIKFLESTIETPSYLPENSHLDTALVAAIAILAVLLLISLALYLYLRRYYRPAIRRPSQQELATSNPAFDETINGDSIILDDVAPKMSSQTNGYLKPIWTIPERHFDIHGPIVGSGKYGQIQIGTVTENQQKIPVFVVTTLSQIKMTGQARKNIVNEIETMNKVSSHKNIIALIGKAEIKGSMHIAIEFSRDTLLVYLCASRCFPNNGSLVSTYSSHQLIGFMLDMANAVHYLHSHMVSHRHLACINIMMFGNVPKITGHSLSHYNQEKPLDYSRWQAAELFQGGRFTSKADVWSLGVLFWEIATFGGTPYHSMDNKEVRSKILHGIRLPHPSHVSDELFQLMLDCWQSDIDERPSPESITRSLDFLLQNNPGCISVEHLLGFEYHPMKPHSFTFQEV